MKDILSIAGIVLGILGTVFVKYNLFWFFLSTILVWVGFFLYKESRSHEDQKYFFRYNQSLGITLSIIYFLAIISILISYFSLEGALDNNCQYTDFLGVTCWLQYSWSKSIFLLFIMLFINLPRFYWWLMSLSFNSWLEKQGDNKIENNKFEIKRFKDNKEFAMAMWLASLAIFTTVFVDGVVNNNFFQSNSSFISQAKYINSSYVVKDVLKENEEALIIYENPELTKPIKVIKGDEIITLTGVKLENNKFQTISYSRDKEQLGWANIKIKNDVENVSFSQVYQENPNRKVINGFVKLYSNPFNTTDKIAEVPVDQIVVLTGGIYEGYVQVQYFKDDGEKIIGWLIAESLTKIPGNN